MKAPMLLALAGLAMPAQAAEEGVLALACQGIQATKWGAGAPFREPISMGVIVNLTARTIEGLPGSEDFPVKIMVANKATIQFSGSSDTTATATKYTGGINRVTGEAWAITSKGPAQISYSLECKPTQRMF
jgi:hypothetical protein